MSTKHWKGAGVYDPHLGFVIAGGSKGGVERTYDGISFSNLKDMPQTDNSHHCLVSLQNGNLVAVTPNDGALMYHGSNNSWSTLTKEADVPQKYGFGFRYQKPKSREADNDLLWGQSQSGMIHSPLSTISICI